MLSNKKMPVFVTVENSLPYWLLFYFYCNHQHICRECPLTQNTYLSRYRLQRWYFELQLDYVELKYTPEFPGLLYCFVLMLKQQCIRVWSCKPVRCANKLSYGYWILSLVSKGNKSQLYTNMQKTIRDKNTERPSYGFDVGSYYDFLFLIRFYTIAALTGDSSNSSWAPIFVRFALMSTVLLCCTILFVCMSQGN